MATLAALLQTAPAHPLRAIATGLGLRQRGQATGVVFNFRPTLRVTLWPR